MVYPLMSDMLFGTLQYMVKVEYQPRSSEVRSASVLSRMSPARPGPTPEFVYPAHLSLLNNEPRVLICVPRCVDKGMTLGGKPLFNLKS